MLDFTQPVPMSFVIESIAAIFFMIGVGIFAVKKFKKEI
jgi:hypothetical protein